MGSHKGKSLEGEAPQNDIGHLNEKPDIQEGSLRHTKKVKRKSSKGYPEHSDILQDRGHFSLTLHTGRADMLSKSLQSDNLSSPGM